MATGKDLAVDVGEQRPWREGEDIAIAPGVEDSSDRCQEEGIVPANT